MCMCVCARARTVCVHCVCTVCAQCVCTLCVAMFRMAAICFVLLMCSDVQYGFLCIIAYCDYCKQKYHDYDNYHDN